MTAHTQTVDPDKPGGDLVAGKVFMITGWCQEFETIETRRGEEPNKALLGDVLEVLARTGPWVLCRIYTSGQPYGFGNTLKLRVEHFEYETPTPEYVAALRQLPVNVQFTHLEEAMNYRPSWWTRILFGLFRRRSKVHVEI